MLKSTTPKAKATLPSSIPIDLKSPYVISVHVGGLHKSLHYEVSLRSARNWLRGNLIHGEIAKLWWLRTKPGINKTYEYFLWREYEQTTD